MSNLRVTKENVSECLDELETLKSELPEKDQAFADSLIKQGHKRGLSSKQMYWVGKLMEIAITGDIQQAKKTIVNVGSLAGLVDFFVKAKQHIKYPKIVMSFENGDLRLSMAGPTAKKPGTINITDGKPYGQNKWYGRISQEGKWEVNDKVVKDDAELNWLKSILRNFSKDPETAAKLYGHMSGNCCFCSKELTDEKSVHWGYGATCAKNYGLPHGVPKTTEGVS